MTDKKKFLLRMDQDLWNELHAWAADELRSVNGQIEYVLRQAVRTHRRAARSDSREKRARDDSQETT